MNMSLQLSGCHLVCAVDWISLQLSCCYLVGAVDWTIMSLQVSGGYLVGALDRTCHCSYFVAIWLVQLIGYRSSYLAVILSVWFNGKLCRCSYLVVMWLVQLFGYIIAVIWLLFGWCS